MLPYIFKSFIKLEQDLARHHISIPHHFCNLISCCPHSGLIFTLCLEWKEKGGRNCISVVLLASEKRKQSKRNPSEPTFSNLSKLGKNGEKGVMGRSTAFFFFFFTFIALKITILSISLLLTTLPKGISNRLSKILYYLKSKQFFLPFNYLFFQIHFSIDSLSFIYPI